jgi:Mn-dependent DtxR family transcriptional regulator
MIDAYETIKEYLKNKKEAWLSEIAEDTNTDLRTAYEVIHRLFVEGMVEPIQGS